MGLLNTWQSLLEQISIFISGIFTRKKKRSGNVLSLHFPHFQISLSPESNPIDLTRRLHLWVTESDNLNCFAFRNFGYLRSGILKSFLHEKLSSWTRRTFDFRNDASNLYSDKGPQNTIVIQKRAYARLDWEKKWHSIKNCLFFQDKYCLLYTSPSPRDA